MQITDFVANLRQDVAVLSLPWAIESSGLTPLSSIGAARELGRSLSPPATGL
jgi:hypothetical protein